MYLSGLWSCMDLRTNTKRASFVQKRLDYKLNSHYMGGALTTLKVTFENHGNNMAHKKFLRNVARIFYHIRIYKEIPTLKIQVENHGNQTPK